MLMIRMKLRMQLPLILLSALFGAVKSGEFYDGVTTNTHGPISPTANYLETFHGSGGGHSSFQNGNEVSAKFFSGPEYPPVSEINQFEIGYGGTYYRRGEGRKNNQISSNYGVPSGPGYADNGGQHYPLSGFDRPLDVYRQSLTHSQHGGGGGLSLGGALAEAQALSHGQALRAKQLLGQITQTLAKLSSQGVQPDYGPPGHVNAVNTGLAHGPSVEYGPVKPLHPIDAQPVNPLVGKLQVLDAHLEGTLLDKKVKLEQIERERLELIHAAGKVALGSIQEKKKLAHAAASGEYGPKPYLNSQAVDDHLEGKLLDKGIRLGQLEREKEKLIHAAGKVALGSIQEKVKLNGGLGGLGGHGLGLNAASAVAADLGGYNPQFAPLSGDQIPLHPIRPLETTGGAGFGNGGQAPLQQEIIHLQYSGPHAVKKVHNILIKEQLNGLHYYGPAPGAQYGAPVNQNFGQTLGPAPGAQYGAPVNQNFGQTTGPAPGPQYGAPVNQNFGQTLGPAPGPQYGAPVNQNFGQTLGPAPGPQYGTPVNQNFGQTTGPALGPQYGAPANQGLAPYQQPGPYPVDDVVQKQHVSLQPSKGQYFVQVVPQSLNNANNGNGSYQQNNIGYSS